MSTDYYKIGLGNLDTKTRRNAESGSVPFVENKAGDSGKPQTPDHHQAVI